ncbi:putative DNA binding domain-containing protein [bacterium]|nr:putative DNA binding domain-containing protein [candidate division CSSED10-310 bacterium]
MSRLKDILEQSEGKTLEYKRDLSSIKPVLKTLVAFANTSGGMVVIGVDDKKNVIGLSNPEMDEERLSNAIADDIGPVILPDIDIIRENDKSVIIVKVARFPGPFFLKSLGHEKGVFVRLGSTNRVASEDMLSELKRSRDHLAFDQLPCIGAEYDDLDISSIQKAFRSVVREINNSKLESLGVLIRYGKILVPSNGGVILFGNSSARERFFPDAQVRCARFAGKEKVDFIDRLDIEGTVLDTLTEVPKFIRRNTRMAAKIEGMQRQDIPEYPVIALREALTNAVAHTDYTLRGMQIMVAIFSDRLEIQNPGMLPFGMTLDDLKSGVSKIRNPVIARVLRELDYMEKWGTGYRRIIEDCDAGGYPHPEWQELSTVIRIKFSPSLNIPDRMRLDDTVSDTLNDTVIDTLNERQKWFIQQLSQGLRVNAESISKKYGVALITAKRDIKILKDKRLIFYEGSSKKGFYKIQ